MLERLKLRVRALLKKRALEEELNEEMRYHLEKQIELNISDGMSPQEARLAALKSFGGLEQSKEQCREARGTRYIEEFWQDLRFGARLLWKSPTFALVAVLTLAFGIGANTAIFSVINSVLLRPLPYKDPERLVVVWEHNRTRGKMQNVISAANFLDWREQNTVFEQMAAFHSGQANLSGVDSPEEVNLQIVTSNFFSILGTEVIAGRAFQPDDEKSDAARVAILSYGFWQRRYGSNPEIIGKAIGLSGEAHTVVGIMPPDFNFYMKQYDFTGKHADIWLLRTFTPDMRVRRGRFMMSIARLKAGVTLAQAQAEMHTIGSRLEQQYKDFNAGWGINVVPLQEQLVGDMRPVLWTLFAAVGFVLMISCANVANMLLARAATRQKEIAVRAALGASRRRIVRQLLTEGILLAGLGGTLGLLLAIWGVKLLPALKPSAWYEMHSITINYQVLAFTLVVSVLTGLAFGLFPALRSSHPNLNETLKETGASGLGSRRNSRVRSALVVGEVAIALILIVAAGLMVRSFMQLLSTNPGFNPKNLFTANVMLPMTKYGKETERITFFRQAVEKINTLEGVRSASAIAFLPFAGPGSATSFLIEGRPAPPPDQKLTTEVRVIDRNYFRTMEIPLLKGRVFHEQEAIEDKQVVIISEALARQYFPNEDPLSKKLVINMKEKNPPCEIIGVVGDVKHAGLDAETRPMAYWPHPTLAFPFMTLVVRTESDPVSIAGAVQGAIQTIDREQPLANIRTMEERMADSVARTRFTMLLLTIFAAMALVFAAVGVYGVISYAVTQRQREIGIRLALGASQRDILRNVIGQGLLLSVLGIAIGIAAALVLTRLLTSLLFGVHALDPFTFAVAPAVLVGVALVACYLPARQATKVDPLIAIRCE